MEQLSTGHPAELLTHLGFVSIFEVQKVPHSIDSVEYSGSKKSTQPFYVFFFVLCIFQAHNTILQYNQVTIYLQLS